MLKNPDSQKAPKSEELLRPSLFASNYMDNFNNFNDHTFLVPHTLSFATTIHWATDKPDRNIEKLEKLFPLCFQHWLSALLMPRSVANQRNYR